MDRSFSPNQLPSTRSPIVVVRSGLVRQTFASRGAQPGTLGIRARFVYVNTRSLSFGGGGELRSGYVELLEKLAAPPAPGANRGRLYLVDNGAGKTSLRVIFNTGAAQTIATQP